MLGLLPAFQSSISHSFIPLFAAMIAAVWGAGIMPLSLVPSATSTVTTLAGDPCHDPGSRLSQPYSHFSLVLFNSFGYSFVSLVVYRLCMTF